MGERVWGLDIGSTGIKAVELSRTWQGYRVTNYGLLPINNEDKEGFRGKRLQGLRKIFPEGRKEKGNIIIPIASHRMMVHRVSLPFRDRKKNQQVIKFETEPLLPFPIDQVVLDFYTPEEGDNNNAAMVFAIRKEELHEQLSLMQDAGLDPEGIVPEVIALFWALKHLGQSSSTGALLDVGHEKSTMIIWREETLAQVRSIPIAGAAVSRALEQALKIDPLESRNLKEMGRLPTAGQEAVAAVLSRMADEVQRTLMTYESGPEAQPVKNIFLTGGSAALPGVEKILSEFLKRSVDILDVDRSAPSILRDVPKIYHNVLTVALGAAFGGSVREAERINFRREEFASPQKAKKVKTRVTLLLFYVAILSILGIGAFSTNFYLKEKRYQDLKAEIRKEFLQAQPGVKKVVNEILQMKNLVREEKARVDALGGLLNANSPLEILRDLSAMIEPAWKLRVTDLLIEPDAVEVNGEADSFDTVNRLKSKLDHSTLYKEVQLKTARASSLENVIEFKFQMKRAI
jgi:type IV pilus assembly protein PilM